MSLCSHGRSPKLSDVTAALFILLDAGQCCSCGLPNAWPNFKLQRSNMIRWRSNQSCDPRKLFTSLICLLASSHVPATAVHCRCHTTPAIATEGLCADPPGIPANDNMATAKS